MFFCEFYEISKNTFFTEHLLTTASEICAIYINPFHTTDIFIFRYFPQCVKSVQIRSFFWSVFPRFRTEYGETRSVSSPNAEKYGPEKTPYSDTFHAPGYRKKLVAWNRYPETVPQNL